MIVTIPIPDNFWELLGVFIAGIIIGGILNDWFPNPHDGEAEIP